MTEQQAHWRVILERYTNEDTYAGDVITLDGEVIGTWHCDENDFMSFTPLGSTEPLFIDPMLGPFTARILTWCDEKDASQGA